MRDIQVGVARGSSTSDHHLDRENHFATAKSCDGMHEDDEEDDMLMCDMMSEEGEDEGRCETPTTSAFTTNRLVELCHS